MTENATPGPRYADLGVRFASGLILAAVALYDFWLGDIYVTGFVALGTGLMLWEFRRIQMPDTSFRDFGLLIILFFGWFAVFATGFISILWGLGVAFTGVALIAALDRFRFAWMVPGYLYITVGMCVLVEMRRDPETGFQTVLWLVCIVIATDIGGYFAGRMIGGPKLWPRISPKKTWSGMLGGLLLAVIVGLIFKYTSSRELPWLIPLTIVLALASQGGDLLESAYKRYFGVKDSSNLIPGHGGILDRLDGLLGALVAYALIGALGIF